MLRAYGIASHIARVDLLPVLAREIAYVDPVEAFACFAGDPHAVFLDSARSDSALGRYSFIAAEPFRVLQCRDGKVLLDGHAVAGNPFTALAEELGQFAFQRVPGLPPLQGGAVGYLGYELAQHLERLPLAMQDDLQLPDLLLGLHDVIVSFDNEQRRAWICSSGLPEATVERREHRAYERCQWFEQRLARRDRPDGPVPIAARAEIASNFTRHAYEAAVKRVIDYIRAGDIFQANLSQRFRAVLPEGLTSFELYRRLRRCNPAPFAAYLRHGDIAIASASPERFLQLRGGQVETRPIKGTRPRGATATEDQMLSTALIASEKDRAENVMIVDLLRNDLSRVCRDGSVSVRSLCALETFATVFHLVSTVTGDLRPGLGAVDLLRACFPGGSITGAPKIRAMQIIAELEPHRRGPYCGSIGYIGFDGTMDTSIVIRTYVIRDRTVTFNAGGGIVADSRPDDEYNETLAKARALIAALQP